MLIENVKKLSSFERLCYWIQERESIRIKKESGKPRPWTDDTILHTYRFCSVRRMDDRVSRWLLDDWYLHNHLMSLVHAALARFFNLPSSLYAIRQACDPSEWEPKKIKRVLKDLRSKGEQIFNGAYVVSTNGRQMDKIDHVIDMCVDQLAKSPLETWIDRKSIQRSCENLQQLYGLAGFMSGQIVADLRWVLDGSWADRNSWAAIGPGSRRGMNRLLGRKLEFPLKQAQFTVELRDLMEKLSKALPASLIHKLEAIDCQNGCCEFDKYERTLWEGRRPKSIYVPEKA